MRVWPAWAVLLSILAPGQVWGRVWSVQVDGTGDAPTIQAAIDSASSGDEVSVQPGTYFENIDFLGKDLVVRGAMGPAATVIDGSILDSAVVTIQSGESRAACIEGFTVQGGRGNRPSTRKNGGGVYVQNASPSIVGNVIRENMSADWGGGISLDTESDGPLIAPLVAGNRIELNTAGINGGGIVVWDANAEIRDNVFIENEAAFDGGGIYVAMFSPGGVDIRGNQFWGNVARDHGGAIEAGRQVQSGPMNIEWNLFVRNQAYGEDGPDNGTGGAISMRGWAAVIRNNTFANNLGSGGDGCTGGGIMVSSGARTVLIENNLFYSDMGCGITCRALSGAAGAEVRNNLFWQNTPFDISTPSDCDFGVVEDNLFEDPMLCGPESDNYTVSVDSPALSAAPMIGVWLSPGCGPGVPVESTTWGRIKARFQND